MKRFLGHLKKLFQILIESTQNGNSRLASEMYARCMRKVSGSIPDGVQDKKEKKAQEAWVIWGRKGG